MLRIKLSAGTCMRNLNDIKAQLHQICERKKKLDADVQNKQQTISQLEERIRVTQKELEAD